MRQGLHLRPQSGLALWREHLTLEALRMELESNIGFLVPNFMEGKSRFLQEIGVWLEGFDETIPHRFINVVPPNPKECLILPTPAQELLVARLASTGRLPEDGEVLEMADRFGLPSRVLGQPSSTLSGGESVLLGLAKLAMYAGSEARALVCTPTQWLHHTNFSRLHELEDLYGSGNVEWLVMEGETLQRVDQEDLGPATEVAPTVHWFLDVEDTTVEFPAREVTHPTEPFRLEYSVPAGDAGPFPSPTLLTGANGVGKTVFANLLAGVIRATQGDVVATTLGRRTRARVLMQDSQKQFLGDPIRKHLARSLGHDSEVRSRAEALATEILSSIARRLADDTATEGVVVEAEDAPTFIESKAVLAAERLASRPCVLVLDEPGWCLSRSVARAFVLAVVDAAHGQGTAVVMISHLRHWWTDLFNSELLFQRLLDPRKGPGLVGIQAVIP